MSPIQDLESCVEFLDFNAANFEHIFGLVDPPEVPSSLISLITQMNPAMMVVEWTYIDLDNLACHNVQAAQSFTPVEPTTIRIHFLDKKIERDVVESNDPDANRELQDHYLGFVVVRPDHPATIGRTLMKPIRSVGNELVACGVEAEFRLSLLGQWLRVRACPYMSQDQKVIACATVAIWAATTTQPLRDSSTRSASTPEITRMALGITRSFGPSIGTAGLTHDQSVHALLSLGYDPYLLEYPRASDVSGICAAYTTGGFAPLLYLLLPERGDEIEARHVVTVVGHSQSMGYWLGSPGKGGNGERTMEPEYVAAPTGRVIVHDDRQGMYLPASLVDAPPKPSTATSHCRPDRGDATWLQFDDVELRSGWVQSVVVPLASPIMADHLRALSGVADLLDQAWDLGALEEKDVLLRPMLIRSRDFKDSLYVRTGMPDAARTFYRRLPMPLYIWLIEMSYPPASLTSDRGRGPRRVRIPGQIRRSGIPLVEDQPNAESTALGTQLVFGEFLLDSSRPGLKASSALAEHFPRYIGGDLIPTKAGLPPLDLPRKVSQILEVEAFYPGFDPMLARRPGRRP